MDNNVENQETSSCGNKKTVLAILLVVVVLACIGFVVWYMNRDTEEEDTGSSGLSYETGTVVTDEDSLQDLVDGMVEQAKEGTMALEFKNQAVSNDGQNFSCYIANSTKNKYDMYLALYLDGEVEEGKELFLTQLIKPGSGIESLKTTKKLESGNYDTTLVFTQVKDDHKTIQSQVSVAYTLMVG